MLSLLQVGDIHYPDWNADPYQLDDKDAGLSSHIKAGLSFVPMRAVLTGLGNLAAHPEIAAVCFMGDFTSRGKAPPLKSSLEHMSWLCKSDRATNARPQLLLVPGNHDVARSDALDLGQAAKFDRIAECARAAGFHPPPIEDPVHLKLGTSKSGVVNVFLVNTTLGSWEKYLLPTEFHHVVDNDQAGAVSQPEPHKLSIPLAGISGLPDAGYYDQLDTPYVSAKCLHEMGNAISSVPAGDAVVVIGHHNILPQHQPRLASYAEMLNAGYFRRFLLSLGRPIVYLHGHTHQELLEEVSDPRNPRAKVVAISAPKLEDGFNQLSFYFDGRKSALGLRVLPWRVAPGRSHFTSATKDQTICTLQNGTTVEPAVEARNLFHKLPGGQKLNLQDIDDIALTGSINLNGRALDQVVLELFFWRWLEIERSSASSHEWIVTVPRVRLP